MKLNLGCGFAIKKGYTNVDYIKNKGVDIVHDLNSFPYPFKDNSADEIYMSDVLEHLEDHLAVLKECRRIIKPSGVIRLQLPHFSYYRAFQPLHKTFWHLGYFDRFVHATKQGSAEQFNWFSIKRRKIHFLKGLLFWNYLIDFLVNISSKTQEIYEASFAFIFPAENFEIELKKK